MEQNQYDRNEQKENKKIFTKEQILALITIIVLTATIIICRMAYAKYTTTNNGNVVAEIAEMNCELEVTPSTADSSIINPYCNVVVKNYKKVNNEDKVTETDVSYKVEVTPKEGVTLPNYYWKSTSGTILARDTAITGTFPHSVKTDDEYVIVFVNTGVEDITKLVDFNLVAIQLGE